jgi:four helix bundle protein
MGAKKVEELLVWQRAKQFVDAISAFVLRPSLSRDADLRDQLKASSTSVLFNISEGFGQPTDRAFARYLYISRSSSNEARAQLLVAKDRGHITPEEFSSSSDLSEEINRLATGLIRYLQLENRKRRG